ncbi:MAG: TIGR01620 family protein [Rhizobiaceae bacterium]|nr:TIGR01620 family protein [Rhizobiaceae bacterium]
MTTPPRRPAAFRLDQPEPAPAAPLQAPVAPVQPRAPRAVDPAHSTVVPDEADYFAEADPALDIPPPPETKARKSWLGRTFAAAFGLLVTLAVGLWVDDLVRTLFERAEWLGWVAAGLAGVALIALLAIAMRELAALRRLSSIDRLRERALAATLAHDPTAARAVISEVSTLVAANPATAAGRRALAALRDDIIDGGNFMRVAERELLGPLDAQARTLVLDAAKRVSIVTAVSPRAFVDIAYVIFESSRLIRRLAELYGARPGKLGFFSLARKVVAHLAVTGAIAAGDDLVHQVVGQGLAARLSAKLGEGVVNGTMTARIGIAAIDTVRPLPFDALKRPRLTDFLRDLSAFNAAKTPRS